MNKILTILKKELFRFFTDKRMLFSLILPGLIIYLLYSVMGNFMTGMLTADEDYTYVVYVENDPDALKAFHEVDLYDIEVRDTSELDQLAIKNLIKNKEADLFIIYEDQFIEKITAFDPNSNEVPPQVQIFYNSTSIESSTIYNYYYSSLDFFESSMTNKFDINGDLETSFDLATKEDVSASFITMLLPFILIVFLFSGCMAIAVESIAGEKERGTIATLLVTPTKRSDIAIGKILALSITALFSATSSFIGLIASLPKLMVGVEFSMEMYGIGTYLAVFAIIITTVLLFTVLLSLVSAFSKTVKEATTYAMPIMIINMLVGISSMVKNGATTNNLLYMIPIYNSVQTLTGLFGLSFNFTHFLITVTSNLVVVGIGIYGLTRMFNSEKVMFNR
jgi:sodium transport system permease protein